MANLGLFFPNRAVAPASLSGGSWLGGSLSYLLLPELAVVARSTNAANASTLFNLDLGVSSVLRAVALVAHNLSPFATWRVSLGTTSGGSDVYAGSAVTWDSPSFATALAGIGMYTNAVGGDVPTAILVLPQFHTARHVKVEIFDSGNAAGYVQIGRLFVGGGFVPTYNATYGLRDGYVDLSTADASESGAPWLIPRRRLREVRFALDALSRSEGDVVHELLRAAGTTEEVLYVPDVASPAKIARFGFLGHLRELSGLEHPRWATRSIGFNVRQKG